jgi:hypothetical protein
MNSPQYLQLVGATLRSGFTVLEKSANAAPAQQDILQAAWPQEDENITKLASLSRILATGLMVEEAEASLHG